MDKTSGINKRIESLTNAYKKAEYYGNPSNFPTNYQWSKNELSLHLLSHLSDRVRVPESLKESSHETSDFDKVEFKIPLADLAPLIDPDYLKLHCKAILSEFNREKNKVTWFQFCILYLFYQESLNSYNWKDENESTEVLLQKIEVLDKYSNHLGLEPDFLYNSYHWNCFVDQNEPNYTSQTLNKINKLLQSIVNKKIVFQKARLAGLIKSLVVILESSQPTEVKVATLTKPKVDNFLK